MAQDTHGTEHIKLKPNKAGKLISLDPCLWVERESMQLSSTKLTHLYSTPHRDSEKVATRRRSIALYSVQDEREATLIDEKRPDIHARPLLSRRCRGDR